MTWFRSEESGKVSARMGETACKHIYEDPRACESSARCRDRDINGQKCQDHYGVSIFSGENQQ